MTLKSALVQQGQTILNFHFLTVTIWTESIYRKIPKISPSMYKPLQIAPQTGNAKNPPLNRPSKYKPPGGFYLENCPQIKSKTKLKR